MMTTSGPIKGTSAMKRKVMVSAAHPRSSSFSMVLASIKF
jgi:hypothetical protein